MESVVVKSTDANLRKKLRDPWAIVMILTNILHLEIALNTLSTQNTRLLSAAFFIGLGLLLSLLSLNSYLTYNKEFSYLQNTILASSVDVFNGLVGAFPFWFGLAILSSVLFDHFRFKDVSNSFMTMFYLCFGDTMFDTIYGTNQVNFVYCFFFSYFWSWIGNNIIINITLA